MSKAFEYLENLRRINDELINTQLENIVGAAEKLASTIKEGGRIFAFGTGHSHMLCEELFYRAGGLVCIRPMLESGLMLHESASGSTMLERLPGYGEILMESYGITKGDVLLVFSNSGRNGVCIELSILAREKGAYVIAITNMEHTMSGASRHPSGKRLCECADIAIDNCGCVGDASVSIDGFDRRVSPTSSSAGCAVLNAMTAQTVDILVHSGFTPEVYCSSNVDGGDEINEGYIKKYRGKIKSL